MSADDRATDALAKLTANEKECLRRRLLPQTAKEMAADLGISPHAVEKRLKMARTKMGVTSSLAAARILADAERYQLPVPQQSELFEQVRPALDHGVPIDPMRDRAGRRFSKGLMMIATLCLLAFVAQDIRSGQNPADPADPVDAGRAQAATTRKVGMDEATAFIREGFLQKDSDGSGDLRATEISQMEPRDSGRDPTLPPAPPADAPDPAAARKWMAKLDNDRNGRVSEQEYVAYLLPWVLWQGVPVQWRAKP